MGGLRLLEDLLEVDLADLVNVSSYGIHRTTTGIHSTKLVYSCYFGTRFHLY
jgi:hypothetical protein